jgi:2-dehydro-3-deoxygluconokinase
MSLANFGVDAAFVTKLPRHEIGQAAINVLRQFGVDTSNIVLGGSIFSAGLIYGMLQR